MGNIFNLSDEEIQVIHPEGHTVPALLQVCPCGSQQWFLYLILIRGVAHPHVQCIACATTYCDQSCYSAGASPEIST